MKHHFTGITTAYGKKQSSSSLELSKGPCRTSCSASWRNLFCYTLASARCCLDEHLPQDEELQPLSSLMVLHQGRASLRTGGLHLPRIWNISGSPWFLRDAFGKATKHWWQICPNTGQIFEGTTSSLLLVSCIVRSTCRRGRRHLCGYCMLQQCWDRRHPLFFFFVLSHRFTDKAGSVYTKDDSKVTTLLSLHLTTQTCFSLSER